MWADKGAGNLEGYQGGSLGGLDFSGWGLDQAKDKILAPRQGANLGPVLKID
jgi:hypothetical protein